MIAPNAIAAIDVREALAAAAPELVDRAGSFGSVVYRFNANTDANVFAANMVQRTGTGIGFHFDAGPIDSGYGSGTTESIWWLPPPTSSDYLILANGSRQPLAASVTVSDAAGHSVQQPVALGPAQMQRLDLRAITQAAHLGGFKGGVRVSVPSGAGNLIASNIVFDGTAGMSATMKTFERDPAEKPQAHTMRAPMMALAKPDPVLQFPSGTALVPQLFLRNSTAVSLSATVSVRWRSASQTGTLPLPPLQLAPGEIRTLDLAGGSADATLPADAYWAQWS